MNSFWSNIFKREERQRETRAILKKIPIFEALDGRELAAIERILYLRTYDADEIIFRQDDPGVGMYIVASGIVSIIYEPTERVLAELREGDFFGEIALLNETPRSATARARTGCRLLGFFQPDLLGLLERDPRLGVKVLMPLARIAGQRLIHSDRQRETLQNEAELLKTKLENLRDAAPHEPEFNDAAERFTVD